MRRVGAPGLQGRCRLSGNLKLLPVPPHVGSYGQEVADEVTRQWVGEFQHLSFKFQASQPPHVGCYGWGAWKA